MTDVLVLNFTYEALNITSFQRAVKLIFSGKAEVVHGREQVLSSPTFEMRMPSIIRMLYYIRRPMQRVMKPLGQMGARIEAREGLVKLELDRD